MSRLFDFEKEVLKWEKRQVELRSKYRGTPAGFGSDAAEIQTREQLEERLKEYEARREYRLPAPCSLSAEPFAGREQYLKNIQRLLKMGKGPVILSGIGGIGKSAIAREYLRRYGKEYDTVLLLSYNGSAQDMICDDVQFPIANLTYAQDKYGTKAKYFREKIAVFRTLAQERRVLMVIDDWNVREDKNVNRILSLPCDLVITSRLAGKSWETCACIQVEALEGEEEWNAFYELYGKAGVQAEEQRELMRYRDQVQGHTLRMILRLKNSERWEREEASICFEEDLLGRFPLKREERQILCELSIMPRQGICRRIYQQISEVSDEGIDRLAGYLLVEKRALGGGRTFVSASGDRRGSEKRAAPDDCELQKIFVRLPEAA